MTWPTCSFHFTENFSFHARVKESSKKTQNIPPLMEKSYPNRHYFLYPRQKSYQENQVTLVYEERGKYHKKSRNSNHNFK